MVTSRELQTGLRCWLAPNWHLEPILVETHAPELALQDLVIGVWSVRVPVGQLLRPDAPCP